MRALIVIAIFIGAIYWIGSVGTAPSTGPAPPAAVSSPAQPAMPPLKVLSWRCEHESGYMHVRGEVKNVSDDRIENLMVQGTFRTSGGELVKTAEALVDYNPLMPGQTSPFHALDTDNPAIKRCALAFQTMFGGAVAYSE